MFLDCRGKPEHLERTHAVTGKTCKLSTDGPLGDSNQNLFDAKCEPFLTYSTLNTRGGLLLLFVVVGGLMAHMGQRVNHQRVLQPAQSCRGGVELRSPSDSRFNNLGAQITPKHRNKSVQAHVGTSGTLTASCKASFASAGKGASYFKHVIKQLIRSS